MPQLGQGISAINTEIRAGDVLGSIAKEECYGTHQILGRPHLSNGDEGDPLITELGILIEDLTGAIIGREEDISKIALQLHYCPSRQTQNSQSSQHITRANAINPNTMTSPFNSQRRR